MDPIKNTQTNLGADRLTTHEIVDTELIPIDCGNSLLSGANMCLHRRLKINCGWYIKTKTNRTLEMMLNKEVRGDERAETRDEGNKSDD